MQLVLTMAAGRQKIKLAKDFASPMACDFAPTVPVALKLRLRLALRSPKRYKRPCESAYCLWAQFGLAFASIPVACQSKKPKELS